MSTYFTYVRFTPRGTAFSDLHAVEQAWQPMHFVWSMTFAHFSGGVSIAVTGGILRCSVEKNRITA